MPKRFTFNTPILETIVGGKSVIDMPNLNFKSLNEIDAFLSGYGFDAKNPKDIEKLWYFHRRALVLLQEKLGFPTEQIPAVLKDPKLLEDPRKLLLLASSNEDKDLQKWSCALLRAMHVFVHIENDLFASFAEEIQKQILAPFQSCIYHDGGTGKTYLRKDQAGEDGAAFDKISSLPLLGFESKPFKTSSSAVIKLLAKPDALALNIYDKIGVRFVTTNMFDCFRVIRFLVEENLISFPHIIPDQSSNNLYPSDLFLSGAAKIIDQNKHQMTEEEVHKFFEDHFSENKDSASFLRKENFFSGADYKFIKFISRRLIKVEMPGFPEGFSFFYPFEVQIMDKLAHESIMSGPSHHQAYKQRQRQAARERILPE